MIYIVNKIRKTARTMENTLTSRIIIYFIYSDPSLKGHSLEGTPL